MTAQQMLRGDYHPGVQMPCCAPPRSRKRCCTGSRTLFVPIPSVVQTGFPTPSTRAPGRSLPVLRQIARRRLHTHTLSLSLSATLLRAGECQITPQNIKQPLHRRRRNTALFAVPREVHPGGVHACTSVRVSRSMSASRSSAPPGPPRTRPPSRSKSLPTAARWH